MEDTEVHGEWAQGKGFWDDDVEKFGRGADHKTWRAGMLTLHDLDCSQ